MTTDDIDLVTVTDAISDAKTALAAHWPVVCIVYQLHHPTVPPVVAISGMNRVVDVHSCLV